jgi:hypothetical protein
MGMQSIFRSVYRLLLRGNRHLLLVLPVIRVETESSVMRVGTVQACSSAAGLYTGRIGLASIHGTCPGKNVMKEGE